jgi:23S rRNA (guanosine2251-2'-O)-methyltransferase
MLDGIEDPHNFGAILRTAAALSIDGIIIANKNQVPVNNTVIKVSMGGVAYVPVCQVKNLGVAIEKLKDQKYKIVAAVCDLKAKEYSQLKLDAPTCLILGNEHQGIRPNLIKKSDYKVYIPMSNNIASLNVSVSCGIILAKLVNC